MNFAELLTRDYVIVSVKNRMLGNSKSVKKDTIHRMAESAGATEKRLKGSKTLLDSPALKVIKAIQTEFTAWLKANALPAEEMFRDGCYALNRNSVDELQAQHDDATLAIDKALTDWEPLYPADVERAQRELGSEWEPGLLPTWEEVTAAFGIEYSLMTLSIPEGLDPKTYQKELEKQSSNLQSAHAAITETLINELIRDDKNAKGALVAFRNRATEYGSEDKDENGKKKSQRFHSSLLGNIRDYCKRFERRNLAQNEQLSQIVADLAVWAEGFEVESLKDDANIRDTKARESQDFIDALSQL